MREISDHTRPTPACGSESAEHRAAKCRVCQREYARRKRSAARSGLAKRRRYRRKKNAPQQITLPQAIGTTPEPKYRRRTCRSLARDHKARECQECRRHWNRRYYIAQCARRRALSIAPPASQTRATKGSCGFCTSEDAALIQEQSDVGTFSMHACARHTAIAQKHLAEQVREQIERRSMPRQNGAHLSYADALRIMRTRYAHMETRIVAQISKAAGIEISPESPLYRMWLPQIIARLIEREVGSRGTQG